MSKLRKLLALTLAAATVAAQGDLALAADVLSQPSGLPLSGAPRVSVTPVGGVSLSAPLGGAVSLPGGSLKVPSAGEPGHVAGISAAPAGSAAAASAAAAPLAAEAAPAAGAPAMPQAGATHDSLFGGLTQLASPSRPGAIKAGNGGAQGASGGSDGQAAQPNQLGRAAFDGDVRVFLTAHGREPVEAGLDELPALLAHDPAYAKALNERGLVRLAVAKKGGALTAAQLPMIERALRARGVTAAVTLETVPMQSRPAQDAAAGPAASGAAKPSTFAGKVLRAAAAPARELGYLARSFAAAATLPTREEVLGGALSKGPAFGLSVVWWMSVFLPSRLLAFAATPLGERVTHLLHMTLPATAAASYPAHFALAVGGSLLLEAFHGVWINTWQNFQKILERQRGVNYQAAFNFLYMQASAAAFRVLTWSVIAGTIAPWTLQYWRDMGVSSVLGTFFGVLGFAGLNTLYDKGRVSRRARSWIQQGRDVFFLVAGTFLFSGSMTAFWSLWAAQQLLDLGLYAASRRAAARPTLYVADKTVASSSGFQSLYPVTPGEKPSPLRQALGAVLGNPFVKPVIALGRWAWKKARGARQ